MFGRSDRRPPPARRSGAASSAERGRRSVTETVVVDVGSRRGSPGASATPHERLIDNAAEWFGLVLALRAAGKLGDPAGAPHARAGSQDALRGGGERLRRARHGGRGLRADRLHRRDRAQHPGSGRPGLADQAPPARAVWPHGGGTGILRAARAPAPRPRSPHRGARGLSCLPGARLRGGSIR